jgi:hypothetical protein
MNEVFDYWITMQTKDAVDLFAQDTEQSDADKYESGKQKITQHKLLHNEV